MGFFTHEATRIIGGRTQYINDTFESVCEDVSIEPCSEDLIEAGFDGIITMNENYNSIMRRMAYAEASALEETGKEFIYTEGVLGDLYNTIKSFLMKIWERIKSLFKRFIMILDSYAKNDKDFAKKYQKEIFSKSGDTSDFTFKGYKWNIDETRISRAILGCVVESARKFKDENRSDVDTDTIKQYDSKDDYTKNVDKESDNMEKIRAGIYNLLGSGVGYSQQSTLTSEEFRKEFHEFLRSGETEKEELDSKDIDIQAMYNHLITSNKDRKDAKWIKPKDSVSAIMPYIMDKRTEAEVSSQVTLDITELCKFIDEQNKSIKEYKMTYFHGLLGCFAMTTFNREHLNRFIKNKLLFIII